MLIRAVHILTTDGRSCFCGAEPDAWSPSVEAFEETGRLMCAECWADECGGEPGDADEAQEWADYDRDC